LKICVVGSRSIDQPELVFKWIDQFIKDQGVGKVTIISGGAKGVDKLAKEYARIRALDFVEFVPYHQLDKTVKFSKRHFFIRNKQMIANADKVLAIWDGVSSGTEHAISYAQKIGVPIMVIKGPNSGGGG